MDLAFSFSRHCVVIGSKNRTSKKLLAMRPITISHLLLFFTLLFSTNHLVAESQFEQVEIYRAETNKVFDDVISDAEFAISEHNFALTSRNEIGKAISKRHKTDFPKYTVLQFCNLEYAKEILLIDPRFAHHMPCRIAVYQKSGQVVIETVLPTLKPENKRLDQLLHSIKKKLRDIVNFAAEEF